MLTSEAAGGAEFAAVEMLDALVAIGHQAVLLSDQPEIGRDTGVDVEAISLGPKLSTRTYAGLAVRWPVLLSRLRRALAAQYPYDLLLLHYKKEQLLASMLPSRLRSTLVWAEWGPVPFPMRHGAPRLAYRAAAARADLVMAVSEGTRDSVCALGVDPEKVEVVPNVVRDDRIDFTGPGRLRVRERLGIPENAFVVGCISRLHPKKRNDIVIRAAIELDPQSHLILAGDGETETELRALASPLEDRVHFIPTPREDIADVLSAFDVSVFCPSPTEGEPRAVILAMLARRPCIATGPEGVAGLLDSAVGGILEPENDAPKLAALLRGYLEDRGRIDAEGQLARRRAVSRFGAQVTAERVESLLDAAMARRRQPSRRQRQARDA